jgi:soluble lytic murein transglycosylase-like protein
MRILETEAVLLAALAGPAAAWGAEISAPAACLPDGPADAARIDRYDALILRHAQKHGLNPRLVKAVVAAESQFSPRAVSPVGARGLMQLMPATSREMGVPAWALSDPDANIGAGTEYLARLFTAARRRGENPRGAATPRTLQRVVAAYHDGPRALGSSEWPDSTRRYVRTVLNCYRSPASVLRPAGRARTYEQVAWLPH